MKWHVQFRPWRLGTDMKGSEQSSDQVIVAPLQFMWLHLPHPITTPTQVPHRSSSTNPLISTALCH